MPDASKQTEDSTIAYPSRRRWSERLFAHAYSAIMFGALFCTLAAKLSHAIRTDLLGHYYTWILTDVALLLLVELILAAVCYRWRRVAVVRAATIVAAIVCTWSVMNAGWVIRTGTQILPRVLLPLVRDPLNALLMVGMNLAQAPRAAVTLLGPSAVALGFLFYILARPRIPQYNRRLFLKRSFASVTVILAALIVRQSVGWSGSVDIRSVGLRYNSHLRAIGSLLSPRHKHLDVARRHLPSTDEIELARSETRPPMNVVVIILEGVQYQHTSLEDGGDSITPFLERFAGEGVEFSNTRSCLTHTTKAIFSVLTGRYPSASQDLAETVPAVEPYMSLATVLEEQLGYRTAFFQSAKGNFEARPGLVYNLGFDTFFSRDDIEDPNHFIGYLACDEFALLEPVTQWIGSSDEPFFLTYLCSVTHDPYEVPEWFAEPAKDPMTRYRQTIAYTDTFLAAMDAELSQLGIADETILCVVGDHAEAFGEHGLSGHERIAYEEVLRIPFCIRAPFFTDAGREIDGSVSSIDVAPTILGLLGFDSSTGRFDGLNVLGEIPEDRRVYFGGWIPDGPAGFVRGDVKFVYNPTNESVLAYNLTEDPVEFVAISPSGRIAEEIGQDIANWRSNSIFHINQERAGRKVLYDNWLCWWTERVAEVRYKPGAEL